MRAGTIALMSAGILLVCFKAGERNQSSLLHAFPAQANPAVPPSGNDPVRTASFIVECG